MVPTDTDSLFPDEGFDIDFSAFADSIEDESLLFSSVKEPDIRDGAAAAGSDALPGGLFGDYADNADELFFYDSSEYLIYGDTDGIDVLVGGNDLSLGALLSNTDPVSGPIVGNIEVLLKGSGDILSLTDVNDLGRYGITICDEQVTLNEKWTANSGPDENGISTYLYTGGDAALTLETTLTLATDSVDPALATQMIVLQNAMV